MKSEEHIRQYNKVYTAVNAVISQLDKNRTLDFNSESNYLLLKNLEDSISEWTGSTAKNFLEAISLKNTKQVLQSKTNFSKTLDEKKINIIPMQQNEYTNEGKFLTIAYSLHDTLFGRIIIASTAIGICLLNFLDEHQDGISLIKKKFKNATLIKRQDLIHEKALELFKKNTTTINSINLHIKGTYFQFKVWNSLLKIPAGSLQTYGKIAASINQKKASRAVGTAIGANPIAYIIPCHRIIQSSGNLGGYMWNPIRKAIIIGSEMT